MHVLWEKEWKALDYLFLLDALFLIQSVHYLYMIHCLNESH